LKELLSTIEGRRDNKAQVDEALGSLEKDLNGLQKQLDAIRSDIDELENGYSAETKGLRDER
jgi:archaellum component FlaC